MRPESVSVLACTLSSFVSPEPSTPSRYIRPDTQHGGQGAHTTYKSHELDLMADTKEQRVNSRDMVSIKPTSSRTHLFSPTQQANTSSPSPPMPAIRSTCSEAPSCYVTQHYLMVLHLDRCHKLFLHSADSYSPFRTLLNMAPQEASPSFFYPCTLISSLFVDLM